MSLPEAFNPRSNPELALQTYEYFGGDLDRAQSRSNFIQGVDSHLRLAYPKLTHEAVDPLITNLQHKLGIAEDIYGDDSATASSIRYRLEEAEFLDTAVELNAGHTQLAPHFYAANEALYGSVDESMVGELWHDFVEAYAGARTTDTSVARLWDELDQGFSIVLANGEPVTVPSLCLPTAEAGTHALSDAAASYLANEWRLFAAPLMEARALTADIIAAELGLDYPYDIDNVSFSGNRLQTAFKIGATSLSEVYHIHQFSVESEPAATAANWQTSKHAVIIGLARSSHAGRYPIVGGVLAHESTHAVKAAQGANSDEPALATGVFTTRADGTWVNYLDYEEGNNILGERLLSVGKASEPARQAIFDLMLYMLQVCGYDDRQVFETYTRIMAIEMLVKNPRDDEANILAMAGEFTAEKLERLLRGTPTHPQIRLGRAALAYSKDLAYRRGYRTAVNFWNNQAEIAHTLTNPQQHIHDIFVKQNMGKIDPSEPKQATLVGL